MLNWLKIKGFRGIRELELPNLTKINVLVGFNSAGKSSVLEAASLLLDGPVAYSYVLCHRDGVNNSPDGLCLNNDRFELQGHRTIIDSSDSPDNKQELAFNFHCDDKGLGFATIKTPQRGSSVLLSQSKMYMSVDENEPPPRAYSGLFVNYIDTDRGRGYDLEEELAHLDTTGERREFLTLAAEIIPSIVDIRLVLVTGKPQVFVEERDNIRWPLASGGDGLRRLMLLAGRMAPRREVYLVEDPEAFQHPKAIRTVARLLWTKSVESQIFVSTHSIDMVRALIADVNGEPLADQIRIYILTRDKSGLVDVVHMNGNQAKAKSRERQLRQSLGYLVQ